MLFFYHTEERLIKLCDTANRIRKRRKFSVLDIDDFLRQRISMLTDEEINLIFHRQFPSELTREELEQKEDLYSLKLSDELDRDHAITYSNSEEWK